MYRILTTLFLLLAIAVASPACVAEIYKWKDKHGKLHFGDRPPPDVEAPQEVDIKNAPVADGQPPDSAERLDRQRRLLDSYASDREEKKQAAAKDKEQKAQRARQCIQAKHNLKVMKQAGVHYSLDDIGEEVYASDAEREKSIQQYQGKISKYCK